MFNKIRDIGVVMGGPSSEREISIRSGTAISGALAKKGYNVVKLVIGAERDKSIALMLEKNDLDIVFIALHGRYGEDGTIQKIFEDYNIPYTGSGVLANYNSLNKVIAKKIFVREDIRTPDYEIIRRENSFRRIELSLPVVIKPPFEGSSIGMTIARTPEEYKAGVKKAFRCEGGSSILVEKFIEGRELTVGILDDEALPVINIVPKSGQYDYSSKYTKGMTDYIIPADVPHEIYDEAQGLGLKAHKSLNCYGFSRVDLIFGDDGFCYVLEINTIPGFTETSLFPKAAKSCGLEFGDLCERILTSGFSRFAKLNINKTTGEHK